jgi:hypothetical protein
MAGGEPPRHHLSREEQGVLQAERLNEERANRLFIRHLCQSLDQASCDPEGGVVVGDGLTRLRQLAQLGHRLDVPLKRVVPLARVLEEVAVPPRRVVEELQDRHRVCGLLVDDAELGEVAANTSVEIHASLLDEPHNRSGGERLRRRAAEEERPLVHGQRILDARDAVERMVFLPVMEQTNGDTRDLQLLRES